MATIKGRQWTLAQWAAIATILGLIVAIIGLFSTVNDKSARLPLFRSLPADPHQSAVPAAPKSTGPDAKTSTAVRFLSSRSSTSDPQEIPYFDGYAESGGTQSVNGEQFVRNVNFPHVCSDTSANFADYNLGRHFSNFSATIGPSDISKSKAYHFEVWNDDQRVVSVTLRHGESKLIEISVQGASS